MFHDDVREARIRAGLSQSTLAKRAGVPRSQLRKLEEGGNVTLATVEKVLAQLPGVKLSITPDAPDEAALREAVETLKAAAERLLDLLAGRRAEPPAGATRYEDGLSIRPELAERLEAIIDQIKAGRYKTTLPIERTELSDRFVQILEEIVSQGEDPNEGH